MWAPPRSWRGSNERRRAVRRGLAWAKGPAPSRPSCTTELRVRSSRHQVARAASRASGWPRAPGCRPPRRPPGCRPSAPRRPWGGRRAPRRGGAAPAAWPRWRTRTRRPPSSRRPWPPRTGRRRSGRPGATPHTRPSGDQVLGRVPVQPVGSMHHTRPSRARAPSVVAQQVALDAGRHHRTAPARGWPARPGSSSSRSGSARRPRGTGPARRRCPPAARRPGTTPRSRRPAGGVPGLDQQRAQVAPPWPSARRGASCRGRACGALPPGTTGRPRSAPPSASGSTAAARPVIA